MIWTIFFASSLAAAAPTYPETFLWGVAYSAHQTEGSVAGGGTGSDWYKFELDRRGGKTNIKNGDNTAVAIDHWNRFDEDHDLAVKLGTGTIRTSVAWEKLEPRPGEFNKDAIAHYRKMFSAMKSKGLKPMIALHHFVHPEWFHQLGGWTNPESPKWFLRYADFVVRNLGDICDLWITFNEPVLQVAFGYIAGKTPPLKHNPWKAFDAAWNIARAHRMVAHRIHQVQGPSPNGKGADGKLRGVGIAQSTQLFDPADPKNPGDVKTSDEIDELVNWAFIRSIESDRLQFKFPKSVVSKILGAVDKPFPSDDFGGEDPGPMQDWIGINYYSRYILKKSSWSPIGLTWVKPKGTLGDNGWEVYPEGLARLLKRAAQFKKPLVVTENGMADAADSRRPQFIRDHLKVLDGAMASGLDIRGYYFWSLADNFEWLEGFEKRFGLVEIKYEDGLKREPRGSFGVYKEEIRARKP
ncbi:MAG: glycoside hydrolase family 1 protein [Bdellovibrionia bacterium]